MHTFKYLGIRRTTDGTFTSEIKIEYAKPEQFSEKWETSCAMNLPEHQRVLECYTEPILSMEVSHDRSIDRSLDH